MKNKIYLGIISLIMGLAFASCEDDDFTIVTTPVLNDSSVVTGSSEVTASQPQQLPCSEQWMV